MEPTYVDVLCARADVAAALSDMWQLVSTGDFDYAMYMHFEYLLARDEYREMAKHLDWMESNRLTDSYLIVDGLAEEFRV